jgi:hypothetical protein
MSLACLDANTTAAVRARYGGYSTAAPAPKPRPVRIQDPPSAPGEIRAIPDFEGRYSVTRDGRVWSHPKNGAGIHGRGHAGMWLSRYQLPLKAGFGVTIHGNDGHRRTMQVRRLVRMAWGQE